MASIQKRARALEEEFFRQEEAKKLADRKTEQRTVATKEALRSVSGMTDDEVLDRLVEIGIGPDTIAALSLVPLVEVAWADGEVQEREREAILMAAQGKGIEAKTDTHALLERWLKTRPSPELMKVWVAYVHSLDEQLTPEQLKILKRQVVGRATAVAAAAGGILGMKKVSASEKAVIAQLETAFDERGEKTDE